MNLNNAIVAFVAASALLAGSTGVLAGGKEEAKVDLTTFKCKDIMRMSGEDRSVALGVLNGYVLGKRGTTTYVSSEVGNKTDAFVEYCLDHPDEPALAAFEKAK